MNILPGRMIYLGYGKFWRSDEIVGLLPIEEGRGPGRRTEVFVATREEPVLASRSEHTILSEMASMPDDAAHASEMRSALESLLEELADAAIAGERKEKMNELATVPLLLAMLVWSGWIFASYEGWSWVGQLGWVLSVGTVMGAIGMALFARDEVEERGSFRGVETIQQIT